MHDNSVEVFSSAVTLAQTDTREIRVYTAKKVNMEQLLFKQVVFLVSSL